MTVEVIYANDAEQHRIQVQLAPHSTIEKAIDCSGILLIFPEIDLTRQKVGIFSQLKSLSDLVQAGDRIEIYRPLLINPKEARKKRAEAKPQRHDK